MFKDIYFFTLTFYKNDDIGNVRSKLAISCFKNILELGSKLIVIDGESTHQDFLREMARLKEKYKDNFILETKPELCMSGSRLYGLQKAIQISDENSIFFCTDPEKSGLITKENILNCIKPIIEGKADIVIPQRSDVTFETMPSFQKIVEQGCNEQFNKLFMKFDKKILDYWIGVRIFNKRALESFLNYKPNREYPWGFLFISLMMAKKEGLKFASSENNVEFDYHVLTQIEEGNESFNYKRILQTATLFAEFGKMNTLI